MLAFLPLFLLSSSSEVEWQPSPSLPSLSSGKVSNSDVAQVQQILVDYIALKMKYSNLKTSYDQVTELHQSLVHQLILAQEEIARLTEELEVQQWGAAMADEEKTRLLQEIAVSLPLVPSPEVEGWAGTGESPDVLEATAAVTPMYHPVTPMWEDHADPQLLSTQLSISLAEGAELQQLVMNQQHQNVELDSALEMMKTQLELESENTHNMEKQLHNMHYEKRGLEIQLGLAQRETEKAREQLESAQDVASYYRERYDQLFAQQEEKTKMQNAKVEQLQREYMELRKQIQGQNAMVWTGKSQNVPQHQSAWDQSTSSSSFPSSSRDENELQQTGESWNDNHGTNFQNVWSPTYRTNQPKEIVTMIGPFFGPISQ